MRSSGPAALELGRRLQPGQARHRHVEDGQVDLVGHARARRPRRRRPPPRPPPGPARRRAPSAGRAGPSGDRRRAGPGSSAGPSFALLGSGMSSRTSVPPAAPELEREAAADVQGALATCRRCRRRRLPTPRGSPRPLSRTTSRSAPSTLLKGDQHLGRPRVAHHVGQALLGHPVDHQLDLRAQLLGPAERRAGAPPSGPGAPPRSWQSPRSALCRPRSSSVSGRSSRAIRRTSSRLLPDRRRGASRRPLELEHHAGQHLADLVVQLARHAPALLLLGRERHAAALAALRLEALEHVVEGDRQRAHLRVRVRRPRGADPAPAARTERIVRSGAAAVDTRRRSSARFTTSETTNPVTRMTDWVSVTG